MILTKSSHGKYFWCQKIKRIAIFQTIIRCSQKTFLTLQEEYLNSVYFENSAQRFSIRLLNILCNRVQNRHRIFTFLLCHLGTKNICRASLIVFKIMYLGSRKERNHNPQTVIISKKKALTALSYGIKNSYRPIYFVYIWF